MRSVVSARATASQVGEPDPIDTGSRRGGWRSVPFYPGLFFAAWIVSLLTESTASVHALLRPLAVGLLVVLAIQIAISLVVRNRHLGALLLLIVGMGLVGLRAVALVIVVALVIALLVAARHRRRLSSLPWDIPTRSFNLISTITLVLAIATGVLAGALWLPLGEHSSVVSGARLTGLPDIYLVLLDGYPRSDTLSVQFDYDNEPFLSEMGALGFDVARNSHSNYNVTALTLASMLNMTRVGDLTELDDIPDTRQGQYRALARSIVRARAFDALRASDYEIVSIPSPFTNVTAYSADRLLDSGQMTEFEYEILQQGAFPSIVSGPQSHWLIGQHRERIAATFDKLRVLATERQNRPKFVFAHVMAPHPPIAFGPTGEERDGWPCFPAHCSIWTGGEWPGDDWEGPTGDQVAYVNSRVVATAKDIIANSARPPVIIFLSDHGHRHEFADPDEMLRSFFLASTPGHAGMFPEDVTPINVVPRLLRAYTGAAVPMAPEESYWLDLAKFGATGPLDLAQRTVQDP